MREKELLFRGTRQVVRRPPKDGRPVPSVTCGPAAEKAQAFLHENCFAARLGWRSTVRLLSSCMRA